MDQATEPARQEDAVPPAVFPQSRSAAEAARARPSETHEIEDFRSLSMGEFIDQHLREQPHDSRESVMEALAEAREMARRVERCECGGKLWIVGTIFFGPTCLECATGDSRPFQAPEIDGA